MGGGIGGGGDGRRYQYPLTGCTECEKNYFKVLTKGGICEKCPENVWVWMALYGLALVAIGVFVLIFMRKGPSVGVLGVGVDYFQVVAIFASFDLKVRRRRPRAYQTAIK